MERASNALRWFRINPISTEDSFQPSEASHSIIETNSMRYNAHYETIQVARFSFISRLAPQRNAANERSRRR